jgi:histidinol-phosphatase
VSEADESIEEMARRLVRERHPEMGVFGEEQGDSSGDRALRLFLDPIDGTRNFIRGIPVFATLLGVENEGEIVAGVISAPALGLRWRAARGAGAFEGSRRLRVSDVADVQRAHLFHASVAGSAEPGLPTGALPLMQRAERTRGFGDFYMHVLVAEGAGEIALDPVVAPWDVAAIQIVVEEAGGRATSFQGERTIRGGSFLSTNGLLHEEALAALAAGFEPGRDGGG